MKEQHVAIDTLLVNTVNRTAQRVQTTAESVQHVLNAGGLPQAVSRGIELKQTSPCTTKPFNEALVPLYPIIQNTQHTQN